MRRPTGRRLAEIGNNQPSTPCRSSCRDCPSSRVIDAAAHETKPLELPVSVFDGYGGRQRGPRPTAVPPPLLAATRTSTRSGPPAAVDGRHPGRSAPFKVHGAAILCARASSAAFCRVQGLLARSRADGGPPATASRHTHEHPTLAHIPESCGALHNPCGGAPHWVRCLYMPLVFNFQKKTEIVFGENHDPFA